jgi:hypothetical protein
MYFPISDWLAAFLVTLAIEVPVVTLVVRRAQLDLLRLIVVIVFANLATHLSVWYVLTQLLLFGTPSYVAAAESWAIVAEALIYWAAIRGLTAQRALAAAAAANVTSFLVGRALLMLWPGFYR